MRSRSTYNTAGLRRGGPGRPLGRKNKIPPGVKASVKEVCEEVAGKHREDIREAILKGIKARPPHSLRYIELAAYYVDGKPAETVKLKAPAMLPPYIIIPPTDRSDD